MFRVDLYVRTYGGSPRSGVFEWSLARLKSSPVMVQGGHGCGPSEGMRLMGVKESIKAPLMR
jgi:hypothetical protein